MKKLRTSAVDLQQDMMDMRRRVRRRILLLGMNEVFDFLEWTIGKSCA